MLNEAYAHFYKQWKTMIKRAGEAAMIAVYPFISILSLGIFAFFVTARGSPAETMLFVLVGVIVWDIYSIAQRYGSFSLMLDIWNDCMKHTFAGSSSFWGFVLGNSLFGAFTGFAVFLVMGFVGVVLFGFSIFGAGIFLLNFIPVFVFGISFGLFVGALILIKGEKYMSLVWITPGILLIFSGIYYPIDLLPGPVQAISLAIPTTHSLISLRASLGFQPELAIPEFWIGAILSVLFFVISLYVFRWSIEASKRSGMLVRH